MGGDFHFATALARELERRGHRARVEVLPEEEDLAEELEDVVIVLRGRARHTPQGGPAQRALGDQPPGRGARRRVRRL